MGLDTLFAALEGRRMFVNCRITPRNDGSGKTDKVPTNASGYDIDAQKPDNWRTSADVLATGLPIGVVIHEDCGLACIDLDAALQPDGSWSPFSIEICQRFPGAFVEVSASGTGLHIFFTCAKGLPLFRTRKASTKGLEIYVRRRFIQITGTHATGDPRVDHTPALLATIDEFFNKEAPAVLAEDFWTTEPIPGWRGGGTDEQIVQMLRNKQTARNSFGTGVTFADLWDCNVDKLAHDYPPDKSGNEAYNGSSADQALANHLAYGTGYNCEHVLQLMWQSKLVRPKWDREDYLPRTIRRAVASKMREAEPPAPPVEDEEADRRAMALLEVPSPPLEEVPDPPTEFSIAAAPWMRSELAHPGSLRMAAEQVSVDFKGCVYVEDTHGILMPDGVVLDQKRFDAHFGGLEFQMKSDGSGGTRSAWEAFLDSEMVRFPRVQGMTFDPRLPPREVIDRDGQTFINSWVPVDIPSVPGDVLPFLDHLHRLHPHGDDALILLCYFAACVQYKGTKFPWAPLIQGVEGNGKTFFNFVMRYCMGKRYTHPCRASQLGNKFNSAFYGKLLITIEDVQITEGKAAVWEALKPMITDKWMEIEGKGLDQVMRDVCFNFIFNSNHRDAIRKTPNDRRIAVFFGAQQHSADLIRCGLTADYFVNLYDWAEKHGGFAAIHHYLSTFDIPDKYNPATLCVRAPATTSTSEALIAGQGSIEQEVVEAIEEGRTGFRNGWINSNALGMLLAELGKSRMLTRVKRAEMLQGMGYALHPGLPKGRVIEPLPDGSNAQLWFTRAREPFHGSPSEIRAEYLKDQGPKI